MPNYNMPPPAFGMAPAAAAQMYPNGYDPRSPVPGVRIAPPGYQPGQGQGGGQGGGFQGLPNGPGTFNFLSGQHGQGGGGLPEMLAAQGGFGQANGGQMGQFGGQFGDGQFGGFGRGQHMQRRYDRHADDQEWQTNHPRFMDRYNAYQAGQQPPQTPPGNTGIVPPSMGGSPVPPQTQVGPPPAGFPQVPGMPQFGGPQMTPRPMNPANPYDQSRRPAPLIRR